MQCVSCAEFLQRKTFSEIRAMSSITHHDHRRNAGFTLIELLITVAVVAILAVVSLPSYAEFVKRGARADAQAFLMEVALRQQQRLIDRRDYATTVSALGMALPQSLSGKYSLSMSAPAAVPPSFTITATPQGAQTVEGCGTLTLTSSGQRSPAQCWN
jgi:type IV pilus assembly protein PilE